MTLVYDRPLYVLPFDHRATFAMDLFGWHEPLSPDQTAPDGLLGPAGRLPRP